MPWIDHPHTQNEPVSVWRWLMYRIGTWMETIGMRLRWKAIDPNDEIPF